MRWGYPFVFELFRFHMTLTTRLSEPDITRIANAATMHFALGFVCADFGPVA